VAILARMRERAKALQIDLYALYWAYRDPRTPFRAKAFIWLVVAYAASPIDLIPDFIPVLGYLDDLLLLPIAISLVSKMIPEEIMTDCKARSHQEYGRGLQRWCAAGLVVAFWALVAFFLLRAALH